MWSKVEWLRQATNEYASLPPPHLPLATSFLCCRSSLFAVGSASQAHKVAQGMSSAVAEIQKDLQREHQSRGGDGVIEADFDEAEVRMLCVVFWCVL